MTPDDQAKLRAPFPAAAIGKLPKPTQRDNPKGKCSECGGWHGLPAVHLDYVGHAAITDRLLAVDPDWTWTPMAVGSHGEPMLTNGGLWIYLTVCGITRPGFGDETNGKGMKETIGDALRNAAMRFGVGLDLWSKEDLSGDEDAPAKKPPKVTPASKPPTEQDESKLLGLNAAYKELVPEFDETLVPAKIAAQKSKPEYAGWLTKQIGAFEANVAAKTIEQGKPSFQVPAGIQGAL